MSAATVEAVASALAQHGWDEDLHAPGGAWRIAADTVWCPGLGDVAEFDVWRRCPGRHGPTWVLRLRVTAPESVRQVLRLLAAAGALPAEEAAP